MTSLPIDSHLRFWEHDVVPSVRAHAAPASQDSRELADTTTTKGAALDSTHCLLCIA